MKKVTLYFGSFNPIHNGHTSVAAYVLDEGLCDELWFVISPQNPFKQDASLAPETDRFAMAEIAVGEKLAGLAVYVSDIEFSMPKPSYTIDTLKVLCEKYPQYKFSILVGADILDGLHGWKDYKTLEENYTFLIYPRDGYDIGAGKFRANMTVLENAPRWNYSSTDVRKALVSGEESGGMLAEGVAAYIKEHNLWRCVGCEAAAGELGKGCGTDGDGSSIIRELTGKIDAGPEEAGLYMERGKALYKQGEYGKALNDFLKASQLSPGNKESEAYIKLIQDIFEFRYMDYYNP